MSSLTCYDTFTAATDTAQLALGSGGACFEIPTPAHYVYWEAAIILFGHFVWFQKWFREYSASLSLSC